MYRTLSNKGIKHFIEKKIAIQILRIYKWQSLEVHSMARPYLRMLQICPII